MWLWQHPTSMGSATESAIASFTTGDYIAPTVSSTSPVNGATAVSRVTAINITFSESMTQSTLTTSNILLQTQAGVTVASYSLSYNPATYMVTLAPALALESNTSYKILLNQPNITDLAGNALGTNSTYQLAQFTTNSTAVPTLSSVVPINGADGIAISSSISLTFSVAMNTATLTASNIKLQRVADSSYVTLNTPVYSNGNMTVTFTPSTSLNAAESYNIIINPSQIKDGSGNLMGAATALTVSNFYTYGGWTKQVGGASNSSGQTKGTAVAMDTSGNIYIGGSTNVTLPTGVTSSGYKYFITKYNSNGTAQWVQQFGAISGGTTVGLGIALDFNNNVYIAGYNNGTLSGQSPIGNRDCFVAKFASSGGNPLWTKLLGVSMGSSTCYGVAVDSSGNSYVTGWTSQALVGTQAGNKDYFIAKYASSGGSPLWIKQVGASGGDTQSLAIAVDSSSNNYVTGYTDRAISGQTLKGVQDYFIAKYESSGGSLLWTIESGIAGGMVQGSGIAVDSSGNIYVTGYTTKGLAGQTQNGARDYFIAKYDNSKALKWIRQGGASGGDTSGNGVALDSSGNLYITGYTTVGLWGNT